MTADKQCGDVSTPAEVPWGGVAEDGTVMVTTAEGERSGGSYEAGTPAEVSRRPEVWRLFTDRR